MIQAVQRPITALFGTPSIINPMQSKPIHTPPSIQSDLALPNSHSFSSFEPYSALGINLLSSYLPKQILNQPNPSIPDGSITSKPEIPMPNGTSIAPLKLVLPHHKLMSYNVENFVKTRKGQSVKSVESIQALSEAIRQEDPDVIALQEVGEKSLLEEFNRTYLNNQYPNIVCLPSSDPSQIRVAMMSKANMRVVETKSHLKEMSEGAKYFSKRDFLETTFQTESGFRFTVYNAHCKSMRGSEEHTAPIRMQEVRNAAKILKAHFAKAPKAPVFVTGDFNTLHNSPFGKPVIEILTHLGGSTKQKPMLTEVMLKDGKEEPTHNGWGHYPNTKLDYIFASRSMVPQIRKAYVAGDFAKAPWNVASDHLPYVTEFEELPTVPSKKKNKPKTIDRIAKRKPEIQRQTMARL